MRIDVVSIFPEYLAPLDLSLIGKAREDGLLDVRVHDLRDFTHDRHRTVDDTPYGGGAGMVMKPQPWSEALDHVLAGSADGTRPHLVVPGPGGAPFTQAMARRLAEEPWLAFACGRYEGIDERVYEHAREDLGLEVSVVSLGDYVLNGGEVAVLAMVEAIARLVPGVIGNAESLVEESHEDGLLEYPIYTKPRVWNGRAVPDVLLSGNHAAIAAWRHEQRLARTAARRPDLLHASHGTTEVDLALATPGDLPELLTLTLAAAADEVLATGRPDVPVPGRTLDELRTLLAGSRVWLARKGGRVVGAVRCAEPVDELRVTDLVVAPDLVDGELEGRLLQVAEGTAAGGIRHVRLVVGAGRTHVIKVARKAGYRIAPGEPAVAGTTELLKRR
jgi:tRNA (guanine37-N1)-methyltransferase